MMQFTSACPNCHKELTIETPYQRTSSLNLLVRCYHCGIEKSLRAFQREYRRQQEAPARERVAKLTEERRTKRANEKAERKTQRKHAANERRLVKIEENVQRRQSTPVQRIGVPAQAPPRPYVQTIEKTGKQWKGLQLAGALFGMSGCSVSALGGLGGLNELLVVGLGILAMGFALYVVGRIGGWWYHG